MRGRSRRTRAVMEKLERTVVVVTVETATALATTRGRTRDERRGGLTRTRLFLTAWQHQAVAPALRGTPGWNSLPVSTRDLELDRSEGCTDAGDGLALTPRGRSLSLARVLKHPHVWVNLARFLSFSEECNLSVFPRRLAFTWIGTAIFVWRPTER